MLLFIDTAAHRHAHISSSPKMLRHDDGWKLSPPNGMTSSENSRESVFIHGWVRLSEGKIPLAHFNDNSGCFVSSFIRPNYRNDEAKISCLFKVWLSDVTQHQTDEWHLLSVCIKPDENSRNPKEFLSNHSLRRIQSASQQIGKK